MTNNTSPNFPTRIFRKLPNGVFMTNAGYAHLFIHKCFSNFRISFGTVGREVGRQTLENKKKSKSWSTLNKHIKVIYFKNTSTPPPPHPLSTTAYYFLFSVTSFSLIKSFCFYKELLSVFPVTDGRQVVFGKTGTNILLHRTFYVLITTTICYAIFYLEKVFNSNTWTCDEEYLKLKIYCTAET